jgi:hypothetical protein
MVRELAAILLLSCSSQGADTSDAPIACAVGGYCFPTIAHINHDCTVSCSLLVTYSNQTDQAAGCTDPGMSQPDDATLATFRRDFLASLGDADVMDPIPVVCVYRQLAGGPHSSLGAMCGCSNAQPDYAGFSCGDDLAPAGWCFVPGGKVLAINGYCPEYVTFSHGGPPVGTTLTLNCLE